MLNISNTSQVQAGSLDAIVDKLNGTVAMVSKLRLSLDELETELSEIRQQCRNAICAHPPVTSVGNAHDRGRDAPKSPSHLSHMEKWLLDLVSFQGWSRNPDRSKIGTSRGAKGEPKEQQGERQTENFGSKSKLDPKSKSIPVLSDAHSPSRIPRLSSSRISGGRESLAGIAVEKDDNSPGSSSQPRTVVALIPSCRHWENSPVAEQNRAAHPPCPPTNPCPFPEDIDLSSYPHELKHEGKSWFVLFNPSPKVKRILDVHLVHDLGYENWPACVRFSRDGKWLAMGNFENAKIYDVKTGVQACVFDHAYIWSVCFSPDGKYLVTGGNDTQIRVWNIAEKQIHSTFEGHQRWINSVDFSPDGQFIVSGSEDGSVRIWDVHGGALTVLTIDDHYLPDGDQGVWSVAISPDGKYVAVGSANTSVSVWEVPKGMLVERLRGHNTRVSSVAFTPDGKGLISASCDCVLKYWDMSALGTRSGPRTPLTSTSITSPSPCLTNFTGHHYQVNSIAVSHDGTWVVSGSGDGNILFWDMRTGVAQFILSGHRASVHQVYLSPMGNYLATASDDGQVRIWSYSDYS